MAKIEADRRTWEAKQEEVLIEKASLADQVAKLEEEMRHLNDRVGALSLENAGLSGRTTKLEVDMVGEIITRRSLEKDIS